MVFISLSIAALCILAFVHDYKNMDNDSYADTDPELDDYFDYLTFSEKFAEMSDLNDKLESVEALINELDMCSSDSQFAVNLSWVSSDGKSYEYTVMCDGMNTSSEALHDIADRESFYLRSALSYRCSKLSDVSQGSGHERKIPNGVRKKMDLESGEFSCRLQGKRAGKAKKIISELIGDDKYDSDNQGDAVP